MKSTIRPVTSRSSTRARVLAAFLSGNVLVRKSLFVFGVLFVNLKLSMGSLGEVKFIAGEGEVCEVAATTTMSNNQVNENINSSSSENKKTIILMTLNKLIL